MKGSGPIHRNRRSIDDYSEAWFSRRKIWHWHQVVSRRLSRKLVAGIGRDEGGGSCGDLWPEEDVVSEVVEAPDEGGRGALREFVRRRDVPAGADRDATLR